MNNSKRRKIRGLEEWKIGKGNGELQGRDTRQKHSGMTEEKTRHRIATGAQPILTKTATWVCNDGTYVVMPECSCRASRSFGFTLVELVIVIAIVIVLSVVSVPIYRSYVDKAKNSEAYALMGTIFSAQKAYYSEYGNFLKAINSSAGSAYWTNYDAVLGIDARGNKFFTWFKIGSINDYDPKTFFGASVLKPVELRNVAGMSRFEFSYNITSGITIREDWY